MKQYTFEVIISEGCDEFWEELEDTGCDIVLNDLKAQLDYGITGFDCKIKLKEYKDA